MSDRRAAETSKKPVRPLIVELYGPSASGKTTLAARLVAEFRAQGWAARVVGSARPAEAGAGSGGALFRRLAKLADPPRRSDTAEALLGLLPAPGALWRLRFRRYVARLDRLWSEARAGGAEIVVFDQAYLSAVGTLAALAPAAGPDRLAEALRRIPRPDLALRLDASADLLRDRLRVRLGAQGWLERRLELPLEPTLRQAGAFAALDAAMAGLGLPALRVPSNGSDDPAATVATLADRIAGFQDGPPAGAPPPAGDSRPRRASAGPAAAALAEEGRG